MHKQEKCFYYFTVIKWPVRSNRLVYENKTHIQKNPVMLWQFRMYNKLVKIYIEGWKILIETSEKYLNECVEKSFFIF